MTVHTGKRFFRYFLPALGFVPAGVLLAVIITIVQMIGDTPVYRSRAVVQLPAPAPGDTFDAYEIKRRTWIEQMVTSKVMIPTREHLNRPSAEIRELLGDVEVSATPHSQLVRLRVDSADPVFAAEFANAWATAAIEVLSVGTGLPFEWSQRATPAARPWGPPAKEQLIRGAIYGVLAGVLLALGLAFLLHHVRRDQPPPT